MSYAPLPGFTLVSRNQLEWAGPCPFTGQGNDRFHIWSGKKWWWCRKECPGCPGEPGRSGGMWGWLDQIDQSLYAKISAAEPPPPVPPPTMQDVYRLADQISDNALDYLDSRGIRPDTARRYLLGQDENSRRLTIPNIIKNGHLMCYGIKKRWLGKPPEEWISKYVSVPGTRGRSIFNWNRLVSRKKWDYFLIVEGVLDTILLDQLGIPAVAPFGGGGVWSPDWAKWFAHVGRLIIVADNDPPGERDPEPGMTKAKQKQKMLGRGETVYPPEGKDLGEAYLAGVGLHAWLREVLERVG